MLLVLPAFALLLGIALLIFGPDLGPSSRRRPHTHQRHGSRLPGFVWVYLTVIVCLFITGLVTLTYETVAIAKFGRTLGMVCLHIRVLRVPGATLGRGRAFGRAAIFWLAWFLGWIGLLDPLWCLRDDKRQCLHDKVADSIVVNDGS